jgi:hypothetical protein
VVHQIKTIKLVELNFIFKENSLFERKSKAKNIFSWPLTLIMQKHDHFRLLRHHYSESPVIPLSNDIWYRCVAHGFITFYFLIFCRWSINDKLINNIRIRFSQTLPLVFSATGSSPPGVIFIHFGSLHFLMLIRNHPRWPPAQGMV